MRKATKSKVVFIISLLLCFTVLTFFLCNPPNYKVKAYDVENNEGEKVKLLNDNTNLYYNYTAPSEPQFIIKNEKGTISIDAKNVWLYFANLTVEMPDFDFYKIINEDGETRFYQADTAKILDVNNPFAYIGLYSFSNLNTMYVQYGSKQGILYNVKIPLNNEELNYFAQNSTPIKIGCDEVSERLKASSKVFANGAFENQHELKEAGNQISTLSLNPIRTNEYNNYTDTDGIIKSYVNNYLGHDRLADGRTITDDPIVQIIPKELFFISGEHFYIGREYGFFLRVVMDRFNSNDYAVDVFVFDISHKTPSFPSNTVGSTRITPLFQYKYRAADKYRRGD